MTKPVKIQQPAWIATLGMKTSPEVVVSPPIIVNPWGTITPDGNETDTGTYTDAKEREWVWYEWSNASLPDQSVTLSAGLYRILVASGGAWGNYNNGGWLNAGGDVNDSLVEAEAGTYTIKLGYNNRWGTPSTEGIPDSQTLVYNGSDYIAGTRITPMAADTNNETGSAVPFRDDQDNNSGRARFNGFLSDITGQVREYGAIKDKATFVNPSGIPVAFGGYNTSGGVIIATVTN